MLRSDVTILPVVRATIEVKRMSAGFAGETIRVLIKDLKKLDANNVYQPVTTGASLNVVVVAPDGTESDAGVVSNSDDDWYVDIARPTTNGQYQAKIEAVVGATIGRWKANFWVKPW